MLATWLIKKKPHCLKSNAALSVVPGAGLEPARLAAGDFESPESTNFTTRAVIGGLALCHKARSAWDQEAGLAFFYRLFFRVLIIWIFVPYLLKLNIFIKMIV